MDIPRFHLAFPVRDLAEARAFYGQLLGCPEDRSSDQWVDFNLFGHQIVAHLAPESLHAAAAHDVDGDAVPYVASPLRKQRFDLRTGLALNGAEAAAGSYPVRIRDGWVEVAASLG